MQLTNIVYTCIYIFILLCCELHFTKQRTLLSFLFQLRAIFIIIMILLDVVLFHISLLIMFITIRMQIVCLFVLRVQHKALRWCFAAENCTSEPTNGYSYDKYDMHIWIISLLCTLTTLFLWLPKLFIEFHEFLDPAAKNFSTLKFHFLSLFHTFSTRFFPWKIQILWMRKKIEFESEKIEMNFSSWRIFSILDQLWEVGIYLEKNWLHRYIN